MTELLTLPIRDYNKKASGQQQIERGLCCSGKHEIFSLSDLTYGHCKKCQNERAMQRRRDKPKTAMIIAARQRAKKGNFPCTITEDDFEIPTFCPILGIPIEYKPGKGRKNYHSAAIDKIVPSLGYVEGNIQILSSRANELKSDGTLRELVLLGLWAAEKMMNIRKEEVNDEQKAVQIVGLSGVA